MNEIRTTQEQGMLDPMRIKNSDDNKIEQTQDPLNSTKARRYERWPMSNEGTYEGSCFCGAVQFTVHGDPAAAGYCHCNDCRLWSAGPLNAFTLWNPEAVKVVRGKDEIRTYNKSPKSFRKWCGICGGHLFTDHPEWNLIDVYAATIPDFPFHPGVHVNYKETVLTMKDGLPKFKDVPAEMGGTGETLSE